MPNLLVMVGLPASGKTTAVEYIRKKVYSEFWEDIVLVSTDDIRERLTGDVSDQSRNNDVFRIYHMLIAHNLLLGRNVIADATNITIEEREALTRITLNVSEITPNKVFAYAIEVAKTFEQCFEDNHKRERNVPDEIMLKMFDKFVRPSRTEELFEQVIVISLPTMEKTVNEYVLPLFK